MVSNTKLFYVSEHHPRWEEISKKLNIPIKRCFYILDKWNKRGILAVGVSLRTAWIDDFTKLRLLADGK